jgi:hypothetical protein
MSATAVGLIIGAVLIILAAVGGGITAKDVSIPAIPTKMRLLLGVFGAGLLGITALGIFQDNRPSETNPNESKVASATRLPPVDASPPSPHASADGALPIPSGHAIAEFSTPPVDAQIAPGQDVNVSFQVSGLTADKTVWLFAVSSTDPTIYYFTSDGPIATKDGRIERLDPDVGDSSDAGATLSYVAVEASRDCNSILSVAAKGQGDPPSITPPDSCIEIGQRDVKFAK